ncbi:MAG TPA: ATP-binding cassette domain-containing protein, partial [Erysipelothrix sp.]
MKENVLKIRDLSISFNTDSGVVEAIRGIRLDLFRGETLAIVGESGSGKSVTTKAIMGILSNNAILNEGSIVYSYEDQGVHKEVDLLQMSSKDLSRDIRGQRIAMVFQDPMT